ncbi:MAG: hypothetical protein CME65_14000 [Halobacteriovoraceae bacterium]|nr:hypothetical protein [Halobacteriovoraceae bacterium]|tara:strand:+ start:4809 stop:5465 length:657 start_codon:yes stop_codon:yes gene_type:complete
MENFRPAGTLSQFLTDLKSSKVNEGSLMVWQTVKGKKKVLKGSYSSHKKEKDKTVVNIHLEKNHSFDKDSPIYLYEEVNGILFKGEYSYYVNQNLKLIIDEKVFLKEKRKSPRFGFHYSDVKIELEYQKKTYEFKLKDVSDLGYSIELKHKIAEHFKVTQPINLLSVHGVNLPKAIGGSIVYIQKSPHKWSKGHSIIGIKFNRKSKLFTLIAKQMGLS